MKTLQKIYPICLIMVVALFFVGTLQAQQRLHLAGDNDANLNPGSGTLQLGETNGVNMLLDNNEILARNNGGNSTLFLNIEGGGVKTGNENKPSDFWATGYSKFGNDVSAPWIRTKLVTGTTAAAGSTTVIPHGLPDQFKIISAHVVAEHDISGQPFFEHYVTDWHDQNNVAVTTNIGNNKDYKLFLIYIK